MTQITSAAKTALTTAAKPCPEAHAKKLLRDAAFVLEMTRRVKAEILAQRPESTKPVIRQSAELTAGLGV